MVGLSVRETLPVTKTTSSLTECALCLLCDHPLPLRQVTMRRHDRKTDHRVKRSHRQTERQTERQTNRKNERPTNRQTDRPTDGQTPWWLSYQGPKPIFQMEGVESDADSCSDNDQPYRQTPEQTDPLSDLTISVTGPRTAPVTTGLSDRSVSDRPRSLPTSHVYDPQYFAHFIE